MEERRRTELGARGLILRDADGGTRQVDLLSGALHYWRMERASWRPCLRALRMLGLEVVETYAPWGVHEVTPGDFDFGGEYDLGGFLDEVAELGMLAIVRPGPHVNAELTYFGFPEALLRDGSMLAVTSRGTPAWMPAPTRAFPVPSYAAAGFHEAVARWYRAVGEVLAPRLYPDGPVVALGVDNEAQMFFRGGAYDLDYHDDALAWWREFAGEDVEAPRAWSAERAGVCAQWVAFKEEYTQRALARFAGALEAAGLGGVARFHNQPPSEPAAANVCGIAEAVGGACGVDFYHLASDYEKVRRRALYLTGSQELPWAPEVGVGGPPWLPPMTPADQHSVTLGVLAGGVRAIGYYMAVDRDRWYGAPVAADGALREPASFLARLNEVLREVEWTSLACRAPVALVASRCDWRFAVASSVADPLPPIAVDFLGVGPGGVGELARDVGAAAQLRWTRAVERALALAQVPYAIVDERCGAETLARYRAVVLPTIERVDRGMWEALHAYADGGGIVVVGPGTPATDERGEPLAAGLPKGAGLIREESLADLEGLAGDLAAVAGELPDAWMTAEALDVDCSLFADEDGVPRVLFVGNCGAEPRVADVVVAPGWALEDAFRGDRLEPDEGGVCDVELAAYEVRMFLVVD